MYPIALLAVAVTLMGLGLPAHASRLDSGIESSARKSHVFKTYLKDDKIKLKSKDGVVTLTGDVESYSHKALAQDTVEGLSGVKSVENNLVVKDLAANSDAWLGDKVRLTLMFHRSVSFGKTDVEVKDGVVTLRGKAASQAQKDLTTEYARDVDGVKDVKNEMAVAGQPKKTPRTAGQKIDDASITAQVKAALLFHRSTSALKTTVTTKNGEVELGGKARNAAEKNLATKVVEDVNGVKSVKNMMAVE